MGLYSTKMLVANTTSLVREQKEEIQIPESFFYEALSMMLEENKNINYMLLNSSNVITEDGIFKSILSRFDLNGILKKILNGFMSIIDKLWNQIHAFLLNFLNADSVIKHNKKKLETINSKVYYSKERYMFTNLGNNTTYTTFKTELESVYGELIDDLIVLRSANNTEKLYSYIEELHDKVQCADEEMDYRRGKILATQSNIKKEEYASALFNYFRHDGIALAEGDISVEEIHKTVHDFFESKDLIKGAKKDKESMITESKKLQNKINSIKLNEYSEYGNEKIQEYFITILKFRASMIQNVCEAYIQLFSAKIDAVKDYSKQSRDILLTACKAMIKEDL